MLSKIKSLVDNVFNAINIYMKMEGNITPTNIKPSLMHALIRSTKTSGKLGLMLQSKKKKFILMDMKFLKDERI